MTETKNYSRTLHQAADELKSIFREGLEELGWFKTWTGSLWPVWQACPDDQKSKLALALQFFAACLVPELGVVTVRFQKCPGNHWYVFDGGIPEQVEYVLLDVTWDEWKNKIQGFECLLPTADQDWPVTKSSIAEAIAFVEHCKAVNADLQGFHAYPTAGGQVGIRWKALDICFGGDDDEFSDFCIEYEVNDANTERSDAAGNGSSDRESREDASGNVGEEKASVGEGA